MEELRDGSWTTCHVYALNGDCFFFKACVLVWQWEGNGERKGRWCKLSRMMLGTCTR